jgi:hypothetical protein
MATLMQKNTHYVDNKKFLAALIEYKKQCKMAEDSGEEDPIVTNYIGECFLKISTNLRYKTNFINYPFGDDMVSDGIENCLVAVKKFNPEKSENPFAYFTQIIYFAFIRRIQKEKKQLALKYKMLENTDFEQIITQEHDSGNFNEQFLDYVRRQLEYVDSLKLNEKILEKNKEEKSTTDGENYED